MTMSSQLARIWVTARDGLTWMWPRLRLYVNKDAVKPQPVRLMVRDLSKKEFTLCNVLIDERAVGEREMEMVDVTTNDFEIRILQRPNRTDIERKKKEIVPPCGVSAMLSYEPRQEHWRRVRRDRHERPPRVG